jgi:hypothetical protein
MNYEHIQLTRDDDIVTLAFNRPETRNSMTPARTSEPRCDPGPARRRPAGAASLLEQLTADPKLPSRPHPFIQALQAIVAGSRDRTLADAPELDYTMAAEVLFLIETLERPGKS